MRRDVFRRELAKVVETDDTCSGCGGCTLVSDRVTMQLNAEGHLRPRVDSVDVPRSVAVEERRKFRQVCPGRIVKGYREKNGGFHPVFGPYVSAWQAIACDPEVREKGSSAGVLTALSIFFRTSDLSPGTVCAAQGVADPSTTQQIIATTKEEMIDSAGSRYAPVSTIANLPTRGGETVVGKPCEISAFRQHAESQGIGLEEMSPMLSFFCAGTPSQDATTDLVKYLGVRPESVTGVRYRGNGWPGDFVAQDSFGNVGTASYEEAWGAHLGKRLPWRCKLCPDGTGGAADIAVGDFWEADHRGFPVFEDSSGRSVCIARTARGHGWLMAAEHAGVIRLVPVDLDEVSRIQPLQADRKRTLVYRYLGRMMAGKRVPRVVGHDLWRCTTARPLVALKALLGTLRRSLHEHAAGRRGGQD